MADSSEPGSSSPGRITWGPRVIAPLMLILAIVAVVVVVTGSLGIEESDEPEQTVSPKGAHDGDDDGAETPKTYTVEEGDLLTTIAEEFGVSVKRLERLNPDIDPQTLNPGQEITLR